MVFYNFPTIKNMPRFRGPEKKGVLSERQMRHLLSSGGMSIINNYSPDFSPTMMSLLLIGKSPGSEEKFYLERGETREFDLNVEIADLPDCYHLIADGKTTTARVGLSVDVLDSKGRMLPYQPSTSYPTPVTSHPAAGGLRVRITSTQFPVTLCPGSGVANLRFFFGDPEESVLNPQELGKFIYINDIPVPTEDLKVREKKYLEIHHNLLEAVHNGTAGYVSRADPVGRIKYLPGKNENNTARNFYKPINICGKWVAKEDTLNLLYTLEKIDLTGGENGEPITAFMKRNMCGSRRAINMATMCEPELPKRLAVEVRPVGGDMELVHGDYIGDMICYGGSEPLDVKNHNSGNRHPLGKKFRPDRY
jgi:hypothetical protein